MTNYRLGCDASRVCTPMEVRKLANPGPTFVVRYFSHFPSKNITLAEAQAHTAAGMDIVSVFEDNVNDWSKGYAGGVANANLFIKQSSAVLMPVGRPSYFAVDQDVDATNNTLHEYFRGIKETLGLSRVGVYGSTAVCRELYRLGLASLRWRTMSTGWRGGAGSDTDFTMEQVGYYSQDFDRDIAIANDFGQWRIGWTPNSGNATVSLHIVQMCAHNDPPTPMSDTTNFANVYPVQRALAAEGCYEGKPEWSPGHWGHETISAYATWQGRLGYRGSDADGIPGITSLTKLGNKHAFKVVA